MLYVAFLVILALGDVTCKELPSYINRCQRRVHLKECLAANIEAVRPHLKQGVEALGLPSLHPYVVPVVQMEGPAFSYKDDNLTLRGVDEFVLKEVDLDMDAGLFKLIVDYPQLDVETKYSINGTVFDLNLTGSGFCEGQFRDLRLSMTLKGSSKDLEGQEHMNFDLQKFEMNLFGRQSEFYFSDLVPGNPEQTEAANAALGPRMNEFMYMKEPTFEDVFGGFLLNIVNAVFSRYSLDELFVD